MKEKSIKVWMWSMSMNEKRMMTLTDVRIDATRKEFKGINKYGDGVANRM
jgi:hypothetical protein